MPTNDNFTEGCEPGPGRPKLWRAVLDQKQVDELAQRVTEIGLTTNDEALAVMALDALASLAAAGCGKAQVKPEPKPVIDDPGQWKP